MIKHIQEQRKNKKEIEFSIDAMKILNYSK
jgi:hypothetical protein